MELVANWRKVLTRAWSIRWMLAAAIFSGVEVAVPFLDGYVPLPPRLFAALAGVATAAAFISRIIAQKEFRDE